MLVVNSIELTISFWKLFFLKESSLNLNVQLMLHFLFLLNKVVDLCLESWVLIHRLEDWMRDAIIEDIRMTQSIAILLVPLLLLLALLGVRRRSGSELRVLVMTTWGYQGLLRLCCECSPKGCTHQSLWEQIILHLITLPISNLSLLLRLNSQSHSIRCIWLRRCLQYPLSISRCFIPPHRCTWIQMRLLIVGHDQLLILHSWLTFHRWQGCVLLSSLLTLELSIWVIEGVVAREADRGETVVLGVGWV